MENPITDTLNLRSTPVIDFITNELLNSGSPHVSPTTLTRNLLIYLKNEDLSVSVLQIIKESSISKDRDIYKPVLTAACDAIALTAIYLMLGMRAKTDEERGNVEDIKKTVQDHWKNVESFNQGM